MLPHTRVQLPCATCACGRVPRGVPVPRDSMWVAFYLPTVSPVGWARGLRPPHPTQVGVAPPRHLHAGRAAVAAAAPSPREAGRPRFDPLAPRVFGAMDTASVFRAAGIFTLCSQQWLVGPAITVLRAVADSAGNPAAGAILGLAKRTVFPHFCAGEELGDCKGVHERFANSGVRVMVDHSIEERETASRFCGTKRNRLAGRHSEACPGAREGRRLLWCVCAPTRSLRDGCP